MTDQRNSQHNNRREDHHGAGARCPAAIDLQKHIDRHRRRHGERPALQQIWRSVTTFFKDTFNIREGRAPYHVIRKRFVNGARLNGNHLCILIVAMVIACIGLDTNSDIAIVGAPCSSVPFMGSVLAIAYAPRRRLTAPLARDAAAGLICSRWSSASSPLRSTSISPPSPA